MSINERAYEYIRSGGYPSVMKLHQHLGDVTYMQAIDAMKRLEREGVVSQCDYVGRRTVLIEVSA